MVTVGKNNLQNRLEAELERLKRLMCLGYNLEVRWILNGKQGLSGEVKGEWIYVYDENEELALETLKYEFIDYAISKVIESHKEVTNMLISLINEDAYKYKNDGLISLYYIHFSIL